MYDYQSEITQYLKDFLEEHPEETASRLRNRALLWDVTLDAQQQADFAAARLPTPAYKYQSE